MYLGDRVADAQPLAMSPALRTALVATLVGILFIGVYPQPFIVLAQKLFPAQVTAPAASKLAPATTVDEPK
jgi:NADH:ubiquinone oxidoreductase subunit 2 (subunit N)